MKGSYQYSHFEADSIELKRLKQQAQVGLSHEKKVLTEHGLKPGMEVLDLGCGPGFISRILGEIVGDGHVLGIDQDEGLLTQARQLTPENDAPRIEFRKGDIYQLDDLERKFDFVYCRFVFQHLEFPALALTSIRSVLNPGGTLVIMDVDDNWTMLSPAHPILDEIYQMQQQYQKDQGGNRFIGRQLPDLFLQLRFNQLKTQILYLNSAEIGLKNFLDLTTGYKLIFLRSRQYAISQERIDQMYSECLSGPYQGSIGLFIVSGKNL